MTAEPLPATTARGDVVLDAGDSLGPVANLTDAEERHVALIVCGRARDADDARDLLTVLGLIGAHR